ncbi:MAG: hypothetical protein WC821_04460 [archaeon]|jgi:hypothetical protein
MIIVFLVILIMALIIANILISSVKPQKQQEKGFAYPGQDSDYIENPEVIEKVNNLHENTALIQGSLQSTNKKMEIISERLSTLEKVVMTIVETKIGEKEKD